jgi:hypothetical protein
VAFASDHGSQDAVSGKLADEWVQVGFEQLMVLGIDCENFQREVIKDRLLKSIAFVYWTTLTDYAKAEHGLHVEDIGRRLGVNRSTYNHWIKEENCPAAEKFFGVLVIVLKKEIQDVGFPCNREVSWRGVKRTLGLIRERECGLVRREPDREELACIRFVTCHRLGGKLVPKDRHIDSGAQEVVFTDALRYLRKRFPNGRIRSSRLISQVIADWARPYVLFRVGLLKGWESLDDGAI